NFVTVVRHFVNGVFAPGVDIDIERLQELDTILDRACALDRGRDAEAACFHVRDRLGPRAVRCYRPQEGTRNARLLINVLPTLVLLRIAAREQRRQVVDLTPDLIRLVIDEQTLAT